MPASSVSLPCSAASPSVVPIWRRPGTWTPRAGYPLTNPFEATIATTPPELRPELPHSEDIDQKDYSLKLRPEREFVLPDNFWPVKKLRYRLARQDHAAPLIFIIAGTGAHYASSFPEYLKKLFYQAGYHVVQLSSPTSWDFMASASRFATPGFSSDDADDLYRVMQAVRAQRRDLPVTDYYLTGYSLGALNAAFVSHLDESRRSFNFKKVLLLNPPVNLYTSVSNLDKLVETQVKGITDSRTFYEVVLSKLTRYFRQKGYVDINDAMLYDFQQSKQRLSNEEMAMLIGTSFRFSAADIAFTSDLRQPSRPDHPAELPDQRRRQPGALLQARATVRLRVLHDRATDPDVASPLRRRQPDPTGQPGQPLQAAGLSARQPKDRRDAQRRRRHPRPGRPRLPPPNLRRTPDQSIPMAVTAATSTTRSTRRTCWTSSPRPLPDRPRSPARPSPSRQETDR